MDISSVSASSPLSSPVRLSAGGRDFNSGASSAVGSSFVVGSASEASKTVVVTSGVASNSAIVGAVTSSKASAPSAAARSDLSSERLTQAVKQVNESFQQKGQGLYASFEKDKMTGINLVRIVDKHTNETITQMPPKEMVAYAQFLADPSGKKFQLVNATA